MKKVIIFMNGMLGLEVLEFLINFKEIEISFIVDKTAFAGHVPQSDAKGTRFDWKLHFSMTSARFLARLEPRRAS